MEYPFVIYVCLAAIIAGFIAAKTDKKLLSFTIVFFIFAQPTLNTKFVIDLPGVPFDLQPNRILLFIMLAVFFFDFLRPTKFQNNYTNNPIFEKFLHGYVMLVIFSFIYTFGTKTISGMIASFGHLLLFIVLYYVLKRNATSSVLEATLKAIVILSVFGAIIAIYQITIDSSFLKLCPPRVAFGNVIRSSAMFQSEYEFGYFICFSIIVLLLKYKGRAVLSVSFPLLIIALILTFHRMSWIIFLACFSSFLFLTKRIKTAATALFLFFFPLCIIAMSYFIFPDIYREVGKSNHIELLEERLSLRTLKGRMNQNSIIMKALSKNFMGLGQKEYTNLMAKHGHMMSYDKAYGMHNGYLNIALNHGVPAMIAFTAFIMSMLLYFLRRISLDRPATSYAFYIALIYAIANLTNAISSFRTYTSLLVAIICGLVIPLYNTPDPCVRKSLESTTEA